MHKFVTHDGKKISIDLDSGNDELIKALTDIIPRLSYDEILDGELKKRLKDLAVNIETLELSSSDDIKEILLSKAIFDAISKPMGG